MQRHAFAPTNSLKFGWVSCQLAAAVAAHRRRDASALARLVERIPDNRHLFYDGAGRVRAAYDAAGFVAAHAATIQQSILEELQLDTSCTSDKGIRRSLRACASRRLQALSLKGRRVHSLVIGNEDGTPMARRSRWGMRSETNGALASVRPMASSTRRRDSSLTSSLRLPWGSSP